jgi:hypothetical protein
METVSGVDLERKRARSRSRFEDDGSVAMRGF